METIDTERKGDERKVVETAMKEMGKSRKKVEGRFPIASLFHSSSK